VRNRFSGKYAPSDQHLEQHDAKAPQITPPVGASARRLFRAHIRGGADDHAGCRQRKRGCGRFRRIGGKGDVKRFRKAEVEDLHATVVTHLDVGRLEIAMHDALLVRGGERIQNLTRDGHCVGQRKAAARDHLRECLTFHELHDDGADVLDFFEAVDRSNVRVIE
jgi:hypothetical protein